MQIRDRIRELRRVPASELRPNPKNWRTHPQAQQDALRGILAEIGFADAVLARETPDGLVIIDGHLRTETVPDDILPVLVLDVTEAEADKLLATLDPLAAMAKADAAKLESLLGDIDTESQALAAMLTALAEENGIVDGESSVELKQIDTKPPPKMAWVLIGIPLVRFGEIAATVEGLASIPDSVCETTVNNG